MKRSGSVRLIITDTPINFAVTIESFAWGENDRTGDISYTITMREYRGVSSVKSSVVVDTGEVKKETASGETRTEKEKSTQTYTVKAGDTLTSIARKTTGSADWKPIYEQNKDVIGSNPNLIQVGTVLTIPS